MYKKRQKLAKELSLARSENDRSPSPVLSEYDPSETNSVEQDSDENGDDLERYEVHEVHEVYRPPPLRKRKKPILGTSYPPMAAGYRDKLISTSRNREGFTRAEYDDDLLKTLPKKFDWEELSDTVREQIRDILKTAYRKTLMNVAGTSSDGPSDQVIRLGEVLLKPVAAQIDKLLGSTLFPSRVNENLFFPALKRATIRKRKILENDMNIAAEIAVKVDEKRQELTNQQAILDYFIERQRLAKEEQLESPHRTLFEDPEDYVQMLMKNPSSKDYY